MKTIKKEYLGDSVYVEFDGNNLILTTENGYPDDPRNKIVLEPQVFISLLEYATRINPQDDLMPCGHSRKRLNIDYGGMTCWCMDCEENK